MDREKVIKGLEIQLDDLQKYVDSDEILTLTQEQAKEIVALLKEQETVDHALDVLRSNGWVQHKGEYPKNKYAPVVRCKDCRYGQYCTDGETTYQCFKWNSNEFGALHEQDWFCADGERKSD